MIALKAREQRAQPEFIALVNIAERGIQQEDDEKHDACKNGVPEAGLNPGTAHRVSGQMSRTGSEISCGRRLSRGFGPSYIPKERPA